MIRTIRAAIAPLALVALAVRANAQAIPTAQTVISRHEAAIGGRKILDAHSTVRITGTVGIPAQGVRATLEVLRGKPNLYVEKKKVDGVGEIITGFDGKTAYEITPSGPALYTDDDVDAVRKEADWYHDFAIPQALRAARVDSAEFEGQNAWRLTYASTIGVEVYVFFDRATGFRIGETTSASKGVTIVQGSYREFSGMMVPTVTITRTPQAERVTTITNVEFDRVSASELALPAAVRALMK